MTRISVSADGDEAEFVHHDRWAGAACFGASIMAFVLYRAGGYPGWTWLILGFIGLGAMFGAHLLGHSVKARIRRPDRRIEYCRSFFGLKRGLTIDFEKIEAVQLASRLSRGDRTRAGLRGVDTWTKSLSLLTRDRQLDLVDAVVPKLALGGMDYTLDGKRTAEELAREMSALIGCPVSEVEGYGISFKRRPL